MEFFINEILEDDKIRELVKVNDCALAQKIAEQVKAGEDVAVEAGAMQLCVLAHLADYALEKNLQRGISREITIKTLKDVNVWIENYRTEHGKDGLKEFCWLKYHYTGDLFHLGRLQYRIEKSLDGVPEGEYAIETHIPQGAPLDTEECLRSFDMAKEFFAKYFGEWEPKYFMCDSWLLNPNLALVLDEDSNVVKFMRLWTPIPFVDDESRQAIERVFGFGTTMADIKNAPERTGLQRRLKKYLLEGGQMRLTAGYRRI